MSSTYDASNNFTPNERRIKFDVTERMTKVGIKELFLNKGDFEFSFIDGRKYCVSFSAKTVSISAHLKNISKKLKEILDKKFEPSVVKLALNDIGGELIKRRDEIFGISKNRDRNAVDSNSSSYDHKKKVIEQIQRLRQQVRESKVTPIQWNEILVQKYENLKNLTLTLIPDLWLPLEFAISVKHILNIKGWTLPFMGVLLAPPSYMKTAALDLLIDYPNTFATDEFTPSAFVSHDSSKTEEQLQKVDMLLKMVNNLSILPELAPLFTAKDEDLLRNLGKILRILDGNGFQSDSGAHGQRGYSGEMMLAILGAAVEIPYRVYKMFGNLGQKIYYLRLPRIEKTKEERKEAAKQKNDHKEKVRRIKDALFDYLTWFDAASECGVAEIDDKSGLVKIPWDIAKEDKEEQDAIIGHICELGELIAHLRGVVGTFPSRSAITPHNKKQYEVSSSNSNTLAGNINIVPVASDFENDLPIIEEPSRAITHLKSVAMGHALSQGRNYLTLEDIPIVIKIVLSTAPIARVRIFDLLLEYKGELTTSDIVKELRISPHTAHRTMTELTALELVDKTSVANYNDNAEIKIKLKDRFSWFTSHEFEELREGFRPADYNKLRYRTKITESSTDQNIEEVYVGENESDVHIEEEACDGHTLVTFLPPDREGFRQTNSDSNNSSHKLESSQSSLNDPIIDNQNKDNIPTEGPENCKLVTQSHGHTTQLPPLQSDLHFSPEEMVVLDKILDVIKLANGSQIAVNAAIESVHRGSDQARNLLGDKITQRDNKTVRKLCLAIIRHPNIIPNPKTKPQLVVRWSEAEDKLNNNSGVPSA